MWQRLQTLYLALGFGLILALFFCNFISYNDVTAGGEQLREVLTYRAMRMPLYIILLVTVALIQAVCILAFKSRMVQMWLVIFNALILLGFQAVMVFDIVSFVKAAASSGLEDYHIVYVTSVFPAVAAIFNFLAAKNIMLDEAMVQSASRLRSARRKR